MYVYKQHSRVHQEIRNRSLYSSSSSVTWVSQTDPKTKLNSMALVRERTIPTERPPPVGKISANFLRIEGCHVVSAMDPHGR
jgi:hypothetical protein